MELLILAMLIVIFLTIFSFLYLKSRTKNLYLKIKTTREEVERCSNKIENIQLSVNTVETELKNISNKIDKLTKSSK